MSLIIQQTTPGFFTWWWLQRSKKQHQCTRTFQVSWASSSLTFSYLLSQRKSHVYAQNQYDGNYPRIWIHEGNYCDHFCKLAQCKNRKLIKEKIQMAKKKHEKMSNLTSKRKMQINMRYHFMFIGLVNKKPC